MAILDTPRVGTRLDADRLQFELGRRGLTYADLAERARLSPVTLSRAKHGQAVNPETLRKIADALLAAPVMEGADLVLSEPTKKRAASPPTQLATSSPAPEGVGSTSAPMQPNGVTHDSAASSG